MPGIDAFLLPTERYEQLVGRAIVLHQAEVFEGVELLTEVVEMLKGFLHRLSLTGEVLVFLPRISLFTQQILRMFHHRLLVAQVVHVSIEMGATDKIGTYSDGRQQEDDGNQGLLTVEGIGIDAVDGAG